MADSKKRAPSDLYAQLYSRLTQLIPEGAHAALALSGGLDSVALLDMLARAQAEHHFLLSAVHVNHHINSQADAWAEFCADLCARYSIPFQLKHVHLPEQLGTGIEGAARELRYGALAQVTAEVLLLAHHLDDQAETLLLNLLRGSGVAGAAAMPSRGGVLPHLARPLLTVTRTELLAYARARQLRWIEDDSNSDTRYSRNYLRHDILPLIATRFPAYRQTLGRAAQHFGEADSLLDELAAQDAAHCVRADKLQLAAMVNLSPARAKNLLRFYLMQQGVPVLSQERMQEALRQLLTASNDSRVNLEVVGLALRRYRGHAWVVADQVPLPSDWRATWRGETEWTLPQLGLCLSLRPAQGIGLSLAKVQGREITLRLRQGGEKLKPACARPRRTLKHLLQEAAIPPWQRERLPLLYCEHDLVAVPGLGIDCAYQADAGESSLQIEWLGLH